MIIKIKAAELKDINSILEIGKKTKELQFSKKMNFYVTVTSSQHLINFDLVSKHERMRIENEQQYNNNQTRL